jgi:hypothetical protein
MASPDLQRQDVNGEFPIGECLPIPVPVNTLGGNFLPIPVGIPVPATKAERTKRMRCSVIDISWRSKDFSHYHADFYETLVVLIPQNPKNEKYKHLLYVKIKRTRSTSSSVLTNPNKIHSTKKGIGI